MNAAGKSARGRSSKSTVPRSSVDILRIRVICNSLDAFAVPEGQALADSERGALSRFLWTEILQLYRKIEAAYAAKLAAQGGDAGVKLDLLKEDHERLGRLAAEAAEDIMSSVGGAPVSETDDNENGSDPVRRFLAAQRHQLLWYKIHIE